MVEDWQIGFVVKGLIAPEKEIVFDENILIRGVPKKGDAYVFFKVTIQNGKEIGGHTDNFRKLLREIVQIYGLVTRRFAEVLSGSIAAKISAKNPFGFVEPLPPFRVVLAVKEKDRRENIPFLKKTIAKYELVKKISEERRRAYLRNAIGYFYHALGDTRYEEKLIDLMIAMESLFSKEVQELRLRISQRAAFLLSIGNEKERSNVFNLVYDLYDKRSKVVHGVEKVDLSSIEISSLESYVQESIKRLSNIEQTKNRFLKLLDQAVYDEEKRQELEELVLKSLSLWET